MAQAKVFQTCGSQAVRIPKEFRFNTDTLIIKKTPLGVLLIEDQQQFWDSWFARLDAEGEWDVSLEDLERQPPQERDWDEIFS